MGLSAIECPDGVCHSHHGGHAVNRHTMEELLAEHGREWCERLAERIYEMSVDTFSQSVMPSLHAAGWQRRHLDWEFKLQNKQSDTEAEPDRTLVDGMINATESFLRSSEVHRLFIQELVQGTFDEASDDHLRSNAVRQLIEGEILAMIQDQKTAMVERVVAQLTNAAGGDAQRAQTAAEAGLMEVERLLYNHSESL